MIELGKTQTLEVVRIKNFGVYLADPSDMDESVLLPAKQVPKDVKTGDKISVFIYKDSEDRLIATTVVPKLEVGELGLLKVKEVSKIGAFLDMGLEKDLLLPFKEQSRKVRQGESVLVALYVDKSERLAATMRIYSYLSADPPYKKDDMVTGRVYEIKEGLGVLVAVDDRYYGMIPEREAFGLIRIGDEIEARVVNVRDDGKLDLNPRQKAYIQMDEDSKFIMQVIEECGGSLPFTDKADPDIIRNELSMSKNAFKRAVGRLLKEGKIRITEDTIEKI